MSTTTQTPTTAEAMELTTTKGKAGDEGADAGVEQIKIEMGSNASPPQMPVVSKLAHVLAIVVAGVIAVAVSIVLADGGSVITLKDVRDLPVATAKELKEPYGINYRLDELLGPTYGVGLHHDHSGRTWSEVGAGETLTQIVDNLGLHAVAAAVPYVIAHDKLKHPVPLLECNDLKMAGLCAMALGFIADAVAVVMVVFHALSLAGLIPSKIGKPLASLIWLVLSAGFLIVICLAIGIYDSEWKCSNVVIPKIKLSDHFDYNYGFPFALVGYLSSVLILCTTLCFTSTTDTTDALSTDKEPLSKKAVKAGGGVVVGLILAAVAILIVMGANDFYDDKPYVDPSINPCKDKKPYSADFMTGGVRKINGVKETIAGDAYFKNTKCMMDNVVQVLEQAGANVTKGYVGKLDAGNRAPIIDEYDQTDLCPVNVHWHLGAEHLSVGQYDSHDPRHSPHHSPSSNSPEDEEYSRRQLGGDKYERRGFRCHYYDAADARFNDSHYEWKYCTKTYVGETYEVHWPHSAAGACGSKWQFQTPFYDGVFCNDGIISLAPLNTYSKVGVQGQVFTIINDDTYSYPGLINGAWKDATHWADVAKYTGSTTGTSRDNEVCSRYTPITWQVDRKCHLISASSFDQMCKEMLEKADDMSGDVHPHGARELVDDYYTANNQVDRK